MYCVDRRCCALSCVVLLRCLLICCCCLCWCDYVMLFQLCCYVCISVVMVWFVSFLVVDCAELLCDVCHVVLCVVMHCWIVAVC